MLSIKKDMIRKLGYNIVELPGSDILYPEISSHPDIFCCKINEKVIIEEKMYERINEKIYDKSNIIISKQKLEKKYPHDVIYNICQIGKNVIHNFKYTNKKTLSLIAKYNLNNYKGKCLPMCDTTKDDFDIVIATEWRTVYRAINYNAYKMYFVQDYEPIFFEMGERYLLSKKTYELGFHIISLGKWNLDTIKKNCNILGKMDYIDFPYERKEYSYIERDFYKIKQEKKIKLAVYVKEESKRLPVVIPLILDNLKKSLDKKGYDLEINYFGNAFPICINNGNELGKLTKKELYNLYCECDFGMVASLTNISLVPYEMIATGLPVIEFKDGTFDYFFDESSAILCDLSYKHLEEQIIDYIENPDKLKTMTESANEKIKSLSWENSAEQFDKILLKS